MKVVLLVLIFVLIWKYTGAAPSVNDDCSNVEKSTSNKPPFKYQGVDIVTENVNHSFFSAASSVNDDCSNVDESTSNSPPCKSQEVHTVTENVDHSIIQYDTEESIDIKEDTTIEGLDNDGVLLVPQLSPSNTTNNETTGSRTKREATTKIVHHHHHPTSEAQAKSSSTPEPPERNKTSARTLFDELQQAQDDIRNAENSSFTKKLIRKKRVDDTIYRNDQRTGRKLLASLSPFDEGEDDETLASESEPILTFANSEIEYTDNDIILQSVPIKAEQLQAKKVRCVCATWFSKAKDPIITEYMLDYRETFSTINNEYLCATTCGCKFQALFYHNPTGMVCMSRQDYRINPQESKELNQWLQGDDSHSLTVICKIFSEETKPCYEELVDSIRQLMLNVTMGLLALIMLCMLTISFVLCKQRAYSVYHV